MSDRPGSLVETGPYHAAQAAKETRVLETTTGQAPTAEEIAAQAASAAAAKSAADAAAAKAVADAEPKTFDAEYVKQLRAEAAASRVKLKELEAAEAARKTADEAAKLKEMSEIERLKKQLADTEQREKALEIATVRTKAAAKHQLPEELHEFVTAEDETGADAQAAKLAAKLKTATGLPGSGGRQPANTGDAGAKANEAERFGDLQSRVPALRGRKIK